jgi:hypothetical protein
MLQGSGAGAITSEPNGLQCSAASCTGTFDEGTVVQLTAVATSGMFLGWSGECTGSASCAATMDADKTVVASFGTPGRALWSTQIGGVSEDRGFAIASDTNGDLIVVGRFSSSVSLASETLMSAGSTDVFVTKLDQATGDPIWAKRFGGVGAEQARSVSIDSSNNVYVTGTFGDDVDFGDGDISTVGGDDVFALKLTPTGDFVWVRTYGGTNFDTAGGISVRGESVIVAGAFIGSMVVETQTLSSAGANDMFVVKLSTDGAKVWAQSFGGTDVDVASAVAIDSAENVIVGGRFRGTVNYGGGPLMSAGNDDVALLKINAASGQHLLSRRFGSTAFDAVGSLAIDGSDEMVLLGSFRETVDFGNGIPITASQPGSSDIFLAKYSPAGSCRWAHGFGGTGTLVGRIGNDVSVNTVGDIAITGEFDGSISFGGPVLSSADTNTTDFFAARLSGVLMAA